ncbi:branched-chain amino acid ABC transporter permease [Nocardioides daphniae]|uniref:Branched-chain amino acid ABC transporter permease n=1 Tax=Nocardioides daphniae TaxID=402297 RepID=A0A4V1CW92_9ACTN|nr:branched-chain amino acid ABC transporter permease [Nocardioides daphniae]QCC76457.1 branched-chain amino acid ABC transporter permease [Nocardioides daphniae]GGD06589.1 branched-chain amino acid ABC transporter permease [Nocardioides daphniae]
MSDWYYMNVVLIQTTLTTLLLALSIQVPLRFGVFSFAGIGAFGIGGYGGAMAMVHLEWSTWPSVLVGTLAAGVAVFLLGLVVQRLTGLYMGMATIAFTLIVSVVAVNGGDLTGGAGGLYGALGEITMTHIVVVVVAVIALLAFTEARGLGRRIDTVREDPELANALGIDVANYRRLSFLVSGLLGGLAGAITTLLRSTITPAEVNFHLVIVALTAIVVGGARSWLGALIGAVIFVWLPTWLSFVQEWEKVAYGFIVAAAAIYLPNGVLGVAKDLLHRFRTREERARVAALQETR